MIEKIGFQTCQWLQQCDIRPQSVH